MKIEILNYTHNPLTVIGTNASYCYNTKLKDDKHASRIAKSCIKDGHGRNMEFANVTLHISNVSARMMREFGRHIIGTSYVQASTRYITYDNFSYFTPKGMTSEQQTVYEDCMKQISDSYRKLKELNTENDITGYILPLSMNTEVVFQINIRALEHLFNMRLCNRALLEFRDFCKQLKKQLSELDEEWKWISDNCFVPKCVSLGYCNEGRGCGLYPKRE